MSLHAFTVQLLDAHTMLRDMQLAVGAAVFAAGCKAVFGLVMRRMRQSRLPRKIWSIIMAMLLLAVQPHIYCTPTQPMAILIAALCVFDAFCMLIWGCVKPLTAHPGPRNIMRSSFDFTMDGVIKTHKWRLAKLQQAAGAIVSADCSSSKLAAAGADSAADTIKCSKPLSAADGPSRLLIHVSAASEVVQLTATAGTAAMNSSKGSSGKFFGSPLQGSPAASSKHSMDKNRSATTTAIWAAILTHIRLCAIYDLAYAALCCCMQCCNPAARSSSSMTRYAFSAAAGLLLPLQMEIGYSCARVYVIASGDLAQAADLPQYAFNSLMSATSLSDLWGNRWHQFLRYHFQSLGYGFVNLTIKPLIHPLPIDLQKYILSTTNTLAVFIMSGLLHEYMVWAAFNMLSGKQMTFFIINALIVLVESNLVKLHPQSTAAVPVWLKRVYVASVMTLLSPLFTEPYRQNGDFKHCFHPLMWPVAATGARLLGVGCCA